MRTSALALLLLGAVLLLAAGAPVQAQGRAAPVQSRSGGDPDPAFVTDASAVEDLTAAGFLPLDEEQGEVRWGLCCRSHPCCRILPRLVLPQC